MDEYMEEYLDAFDKKHQERVIKSLTEDEDLLSHIKNKTIPIKKAIARTVDDFTQPTANRIAYIIGLVDRAIADAWLARGDVNNPFANPVGNIYMTKMGIKDPNDKG